MDKFTGTNISGGVLLHGYVSKVETDWENGTYEFVFDDYFDNESLFFLYNWSTTLITTSFDSTSNSWRLATAAVHTTFWSGPDYDHYSTTNPITPAHSRPWEYASVTATNYGQVDVHTITTKVRLITGNGNSNGQSQYQITASAYDSDDNPIPFSSIQVLGQTLDNTGSTTVWLADDSVTDVTPTVTGYSYYSFYVDASIMSGSACNNCNLGGGSTPGTATFNLNSVNLSFSLGQSLSNNYAGIISLSTKTASSELYAPSLLKFVNTSLKNSNSEAIYQTNVLRQVRTPQCLVDILVTNSNHYEVWFYSATNIGSMSNGVYLPIGSPYVKWVFSNPDYATNGTSRLQVVEQRGGTSITNQYACNITNEAWSLITGNGLRKETIISEWNGDKTVLTETRATLNPSDDSVLEKTVKVYGIHPYGRRLSTETQDPDGAALTTSYSYSTDGVLESIVHPNGSWAYYEYDTLGRIARKLSSVGNQSVTTDSSLCRAVTYDYTTIGGSGDIGTLTNLARTEIETLLDVEVSRIYRVCLSNETHAIVCLTTGAVWTATNNLVTVTKRYSSGAFSNEVQSISNPDGTMSLYEYELDGSTNKTTTIYTGQPNYNSTAVTNGTKLVTLQGPLGNVISRTTVDIASEITTGSETFSDFDEFGRPGRVTYLDSTFKLFTYICCGVESETDRDGVTTTYAYDALKRRIGSYRNGIWHLNTLDAAGRTLFTQRQGTNGSTITLASMVYDTAGRLLYQTNAVGNVTSFGESIDGSGQTVKITTNALGATRIETYFKDGSLQSLTGTAVHGARYEYGIESSLPYTKEIKLLTNGADSGEWTKTFKDVAGRTFKTVYADDAYTQQFYNNAGQLWKQRDADGVVTLYQYNALGEVEYTALDMDRNDTIDFDGTDRITRTVRDVVAAHSTSVRRTRSYVWTEISSTNSLLTSTVEAAVDGTRTWQTAFGLTSESVSLCGGACVATNIAPDGSYTTTLKTNGYVMVVTRYDSQGTQLGATTYTYDEHGRQKTITDARNGTTTLIYDDADRVTSVTTPVPASGQSSQTTSSYYDELGRVWRTVQPDSTSVTNEFHLTGELKKTYGSRTYPVEHTYDYAGRMKTLKTWQDFIGNTGTATTTWNYSSTRGWLTGKLYADDQGPTYTYTAAGRLATRVWARGITTTYTYDYAGQLTQTSYDDSVTPTAYTSYDRQGRVLTLGDGTLTTTRTYNDAGQLLAESHSGGVLDGLAITNSYDAFLRRTNLSAFNVSTQLTASIYGYDYASRLATVSDGTNNATYGYLANSALVDSIVFKQNSTTRMTRTNRYDFLNRLTSVTQSAGGSNVSAFNYAYNDANQRVAVTNVDSSRWSWGYDSLGQVTSGKKYWSDNSIAAGQQFEYAFDDIGNRRQTAAGGNQFGTNLRTNSYEPNALNQYTNRTVAGYVEVLGSANSSATVTVNNESTYRKGEYFRKELAVGNSSTAIWQGITNVAVLAGAGTNDTDIVTTKTGNVLVPQNPEAFTYDADGNLTQDGKWTYTWDAENRLLRMTSLTSQPDASRLKLDFAYDNKWRRIKKIVSTWDGSAYVPQSTNRFLYDGWNLAALLDAESAILLSFQWGTDLSGTMQGAGGVGGLKSLTVHTGTNASIYFYAYDGNGNVMALVNAANGGKATEYEYGPCGELLRASGPLAVLNSFRFSTKFCDEESGFCNYGYRYYDPNTGRWPNRDPIEEAGGMNVYAFVYNDPVGYIDRTGLDVIRFPQSRPPATSPGRPVPLPPGRPWPFPGPGTGPGSGPRPGGPIVAWPTPGPIGGPYNYNTHPVWSNPDVATMAGSSGVSAQDACRRLAFRAFGQNQYFYSPTSIGRATGAAAVLWKKQNGGLPNDPPGLNAAKVYGEAVDRGHLIPYAYGGSGGLENVVTQERHFNRGTFRTTINGGLDAALNGGRGGFCKYACLLVVPVYAGVAATGVRDPGKPVPKAFAISIITPDGVSGASLIQPTLTGNLINDIPPWNTWNTGDIPLN